MDILAQGHTVTNKKKTTDRFHTNSSLDGSYHLLKLQRVILPCTEGLTSKVPIQIRML